MMRGLRGFKGTVEDKSWRKLVLARSTVEENIRAWNLLCERSWLPGGLVVSRAHVHLSHCGEIINGCGAYGG